MSYTATLFYLPDSEPSEDLLKEIRLKGLEKEIDFYNVAEKGAGGIPAFVDFLPTILTKDEVHGGEHAFKYIETCQPKKPSHIELTNALNNVLFLTVARGYLEMVDSIILEGANVNSKNSRGQTPLHFATAYGHLEIVDYLAEKGADFFAEDNDGYIPLDYAKVHQTENEKLLEFVTEHSLAVREDTDLTVRKDTHSGKKLIEDFFTEN